MSATADSTRHLQLQQAKYTKARRKHSHRGPLFPIIKQAPMMAAFSFLKGGSNVCTQPDLLVTSVILRYPRQAPEAEAKEAALYSSSMGIDGRR